MRLFLPALLGLIAAAPLVAEPPAVVPSTSETTPQVAAKPPKICRREEPRTGSNMGSRRVCKTAAEWNASGSDSNTAIPSAMFKQY